MKTRLTEEKKVKLSGNIDVKFKKNGTISNKILVEEAIDRGEKKKKNCKT